MSKKLILIDGSGFIFRAFHALPPLTRLDGTPVGAVYGFCTMLQKVIDDAKKDAENELIAVIFDAARQTFRQDIYADYKAHRPDPPADLVPQFALVREACRAFGLPSVELEGYEADDLIASYAKAGRAAGYAVTIVSSDKDLMQLVTSHISLFDPMKNKAIGCTEVEEKFGVPPEKVVDVQALTGDSTDNVPGVPGIGIKTAAELIRTYGSLEALLEAAPTIKQPKRRQTLLDNAELARISAKLVTLCDTAPLPQPLETFTFSPPDFTVLGAFLKAQNFTRLLTRLCPDAAALPSASPDNTQGTNASSLFSETSPSSSSTHQAPTLPITCRIINTVGALKDCLGTLEKQPWIAVSFLANSQHPIATELAGVALADPLGNAWFIPLVEADPTTTRMSFGAQPESALNGSQSLQHEEALSILAPLLCNPGVLKITHSGKHDWELCQLFWGVDLFPLTDLSLMAYVLDGPQKDSSVQSLAQKYWPDSQLPSPDNVQGTGRQKQALHTLPPETIAPYLGALAAFTARLYPLLEERIIAEKMVTVYETIERPLIPVLARMEQTGIAVDATLLATLGREFSADLAKLETKIYQLAGRSFNIGSPKQLGELLFDELGLPAPKKTKTGAYVTDADVLENLAQQGHALPEKILEWRGLSKLQSTYVDGITNAIAQKTGRVHTSYAMTATATGRLSSSEPNLQNIPIRTPIGRRLRDVFVARGTNAQSTVLASLDYSQIELRLLAHMGQIPELLTAFKDNVDIHIATASSLFSVPRDEITADQRRHAKTINFGIIYGMSAFGLAQQLHIPQQQAADYISAYFRQYPGIQDYMEQCREMARHNGFVRTLFGRKCYTPTILDKNPMLRQFGERQAINAPLQGSNADIIKKAMIQIDHFLRAHPATKMLLQVHDELVFEVPATDVDTIVPRLKNIMEQAAALSLPLRVDAHIGKSWGKP